MSYHHWDNRKRLSWAKIARLWGKISFWVHFIKTGRKSVQIGFCALFPGAVVHELLFFEEKVNLSPNFLVPHIISRWNLWLVISFVSAVIFTTVNRKCERGISIFWLQTANIWKSSDVWWNLFSGYKLQIFVLYLSTTIRPTKLNWPSHEIQTWTKNPTIIQA